MSLRSCVTILVVGALIALGADWLINHMPAVNPPASPVHINNPPLASPVSAAPANPAAGLTRAGRGTAGDDGTALAGNACADNTAARLAPAATPGGSAAGSAGAEALDHEPGELQAPTPVGVEALITDGHPAGEHPGGDP